MTQIEFGKIRDMNIEASNASDADRSVAITATAHVDNGKATDINDISVTELPTEEQPTNGQIASGNVNGHGSNISFFGDIDAQRQKEVFAEILDFAASVRAAVLPTVLKE